MKTTYKFIILGTFILGFCTEKSWGQSALGQLESISGGKVTTGGIAAPSMNSMVTGMVMESLLNSIFSPSPTNTAKIEAERQAAALAAQKAAQEKRLNDSLFQVKHDKLISTIKPISNSSVMNLKTLDSKTLKSSYVPPLAPSTPNNIPDHYLIDLSRSTINALIGRLAPNNVLKFGGMATTNLIAEDIKAALDCFSTTSTYCPSTSTILKNTLENSAKDIANQYIGDKAGGVLETGSGALYQSIATKKLIKNDLLVKYVDGVVTKGKISEIGEVYSKLTATGQEGYYYGKDLVEAWGKHQTGK